MNSTPVTLFNLSGTAVLADVRVPNGTGRVSIIPVAPEILANCALLAPAEHEALEVLTDPFSLVLFWLDCWKIDHDDCPGLATLLDTIDRAGIGRSFDLKFWLRAWRRA